jgi:hypothetical protein
MTLQSFGLTVGFVAVASVLLAYELVRRAPGRSEAAA